MDNRIITHVEAGSVVHFVRGLVEIVLELTYPVDDWTGVWTGLDPDGRELSVRGINFQAIYVR